MRSFEGKAVPFKIQSPSPPRCIWRSTLRMYLLTNYMIQARFPPLARMCAVRVFRDHGRGGLSY